MTTAWRRGMIALTLVAAASIPVGAEAVGPKTYTATINPGSVPAGSTTAYTLSVTNTSLEQQLGSMNLTLPEPFTVESFGSPSPSGTATLVGDTIELRELSLPAGQTMTLGYVAEAPCEADDYPATAVAKQANDFRGPPGNDFTLVGGSLTVTVTGTCSLQFNPGPAHAERNTDISSVEFTPGGPPVQVELRSADDQPVEHDPATVDLSIGTNPTGGTLSGDTSETTGTNGVATFKSLSINTSGLGYTLLARAAEPGVDSGESLPFNIVDDGKICGSGRCSASAQSSTAAGTVTTNEAQAGDTIQVALNVFNLDCASYDEPNADTFYFDFSGAASKTVVYTIFNTSLPIEVCYGAPAPFQTKGGGTSALDPETGLYEGLLESCKKAPAPCLESRRFVRGHVVLTVLAPPGDPYVR